MVKPGENGAIGSTPLFGLNGYMLLKRVWFSGFEVLNGVNSVSFWTEGRRRVIYVCGTQVGYVWKSSVQNYLIRMRN